MYFLLEKVDFHCYVSLPEGIFFQMGWNHQLERKWMLWAAHLQLPHHLERAALRPTTRSDCGNSASTNLWAVWPWLQCRFFVNWGLVVPYMVLESIMTFTPRTLISGWIMVMSRDIISKNSLNKRHFLSNLDGHFFGGLRVSALKLFEPRTGWSLFRTRRRWHRRILEDPSQETPPRTRRSRNVPLKKMTIFI